jgi:hypothetical protein
VKEEKIIHPKPRVLHFSLFGALRLCCDCASERKKKEEKKNQHEQQKEKNLVREISPCFAH